jgi:RimJ/RimL family protein N-acetyltransferase
MADETPTLETERLTLRPMRAGDAVVMHEIFSDPEAMRYWNTPPHPSPEHTADRLAAGIERASRGESLWWGLERKQDGLLLGNVGIWPSAVQPEYRAELGYILGREHWGQGYMNEAQTAAVDHAFGALGLRRLEADVDPRNAGSLRSLKRLGFRREGLLRERWEVGGEITDSVLLGLLARDWAGA